MTDENVSDLAYADTLWKAADALRGQVDAAEYKHVVLGLLFLKYISDSFQSRRDELAAELTEDGIKGKQLEKLLESRDEYTAERVFWVPPESRWSNLQGQATRPDIATLIDDAILAVERDNPNLKSKLPRDYARRGIEPIKMKGLIDLIAGIGFKGARDIASVLGSLDDKIEQNRRTGAKLEGLARAVFKAWFVDFEPVKAKAAGATAFPGMPPETFATLPTRFQDTTLGPVPEGWEVKPIGDVVTVRGGGTPSTKNESFWTDGTHYWATPKDLSSLQHPILLSTER